MICSDESGSNAVHRPYRYDPHVPNNLVGFVFFIFSFRKVDPPTPTMCVRLSGIATRH